MNLKIFSIICAFVMILIFSECSAAITQGAVSNVKSALEVTAGYEKPVVGGDVEKAKELYSDYRVIYYGVQTACNSAKYDEEYIFLTKAATIVNLRCFVLMDFMIAMDAHKNNRFEQYNRTVITMYRDWEEEKALRQEFYNKYGI